MFKITTTNTNQLAGVTSQVQSSWFEGFILGVFFLEEGRHSSYGGQDQFLLIALVFTLMLIYLILVVIIEIKITPVLHPHTVN